MARLLAQDPGPGRTATSAAAALIRAAAAEGLALPVQRLLTDGVLAAVACAVVNLVVWMIRRR
jgi:hypothetical protein